MIVSYYYGYGIPRIQTIEALYFIFFIRYQDLCFTLQLRSSLYSFNYQPSLIQDQLVIIQIWLSLCKSILLSSHSASSMILSAVQQLFPIYSIIFLNLQESHMQHKLFIRIHQIYIFYNFQNHKITIWKTNTNCKALKKISIINLIKTYSMNKRSINYISFQNCWSIIKFLICHSMMLILQIRMKGQAYHLSDIQKVWIEFTNNRNNPSPAIFKDHIQLISRMLIWDDQNHSDLFDFACEVKIFETMIEIFGKSKEKEVINGILGFFTILLTNLARQPSVNYLLSHSSLANLQLIKFGNMGNQIADYYINFLKVLSRKITVANIQLFFNKRNPIFPILSQTIRFFNHPQSLVRTTSRNILLTIAQLKDKRVDTFMSGFPFVSYYVHQCNFIKEYWSIIDNILHTKSQDNYEITHLDSIIQDHQQILIFLDDLLGLGQQGVSTKFIDAFINQCMSPLAIAIDSQVKQGFSIEIVVFIFTILLKTFNNPMVANTLAIIIFGKYYSSQLNLALFEPIDRLLSYDKKWKFKGFWDSHQDKITQYCNEYYHSQNKKKQQSQSNLFDSISKKMDTFSVFGVTNNFYQRQIEKIQSIFSIPVISKSNSLKRISGSKAISSMITKITSQQSLDLSLYLVNPIGQAIQSYLTSKDDSLVCLTLHLFSTFITNKHISPEVSRFCKLSLKPKQNDFQSIIRIQKTILSCVKLFNVDPPCYRICTYKQAQQLAKKLLTLYQIPGLQFSKDIAQTLKNAMKTVILRINPYLYEAKQSQKSIQIYVQVLRNSTKRRTKTFKTFGLLPKDDDPDIKKPITQFIYEQFPRQQQHQTAADFWIYHLMKELYIYAQNIFHFTNLALPQKQSSNSKYEQGKPVSQQQQDTVPCQYKTPTMEKLVIGSLILMSGYFCIVRNHQVQYKIDYDNLVVILDKADPRKMMVQSEIGMIWLGVRDARTCLDLKKHFEDSRSTMLRYRLGSIVKETELILSSCNHL